MKGRGDLESLPFDVAYVGWRDPVEVVVRSSFIS
jgi:hypothetical protein